MTEVRETYDWSGAAEPVAWVSMPKAQWEQQVTETVALQARIETLELWQKEFRGEVAEIAAERDAMRCTLTQVDRERGRAVATLMQIRWAAKMCVPWVHVRAGWLEVPENKMRALMQAIGGSVVEESEA